MMTDEEWVDKIKSGNFDRKQLENLYDNALERGRQEIADAAKDTLQELDPRAYKVRFVKPIKDKVAQIAGEIYNSEGWADREENLVDNAIKNGPAMTSGKEIAEYCYSYKQAGWKRASYICVSQVGEESPVQYKVKGHNSDEQTVETSEEAIKLFGALITNKKG